MIHDDIIARQLELGHPIADRIVFKLDQTFHDFTLAGRNHLELADKDWDDLSLPSRLPFPDLAINLNDTVLWAGESPYDHLSDRVYMQFWKWRTDEGIFGSTAIGLNLNLVTLNTYDFTLDKSGAPPQIRSKFSELDNPDLFMTALAMFSVLHELLLLLSCTNVQAVNHEPSPKIQKKREKRNKHPLSSWYTLHLTPHVNLSNIEPDNSIEMNRSHLCRGHMAEYGINGKGLLFGKHGGRFWISPHLRGSKKRGTIKKDYKL